jgi:type II secretory pathway component PulF
VTAADWNLALAQLSAKGLRDCRQAAIENLRPLGKADAVELAGYLSELAKSGLPLETGLRAAAGDLASPRLASVLSGLADHLESGQSLEGSLDALSPRLPGHLRELLITGARSGQLSQTLDRLLAHERGMEDMRRRLRQATFYPLMVLAFFTAWVLFLALWLLPSLRLSTIYEDFGTGGGMSRLHRFMQFMDAVPYLLAAIAVALLVVMALTWLLGGAALVSRTAALVPLFGPARWYRGLVEFAGLVDVFIAGGRSLDEALALASSAARDPAVRLACALTAARVRCGTDLSQSLAASTQFPPTLVNLVAWGEHHAALTEALNAARQMYLDRFDLQLRLLRLVFPPIVFVIIFATAWLVLFELVTPLIKLITDLT